MLGCTSLSNNFGIVVSATSKAIRRVIMVDNDNALTDGTHSVLAGEQLLILPVPPNAIAYRPDQWPGLVQTAIGVLPPVMTCALVDNTNTVAQLVVAEAGIDPAPAGFTMIQCYSPAITIGCTYNPATGLFTAPGFTIPAGAPGNHGTAIPKVVPAAIIPKP
jgi:hypothetical protein